METVAIVGVGLIGGSFALALRAAGFQGEIIGVSSPATIETALTRGVIDAGADLPSAVRAADLVYLAQPVHAILSTIRALAPHLRTHTLVTDAGSTKQEIVSAALGALPATQFLGGHPMAGKETQGVAAADAELFRGRPYLLTPPLPETVYGPVADTFEQWLSRIGAIAIRLTPADHDRVVACTSHVPQLASTALGLLVSEHLAGCTPEKFAGPGLRDMTRLALSDHRLWSDILDTNAGEIGDALDAYITILQRFRSHLSSNEMREWFATAATTARKLR